MMAHTPLIMPSFTTTPFTRKPRSTWLLFLAIIALVSATSESFSGTLPAQITPPAVAAPLDALIVDARSPTMIKGRWTMLPHENDLRKRDKDGITPTPSATQKVKATDDPTTLTLSVTVPAATAEAPSPLPSPFDTSLAFNFTSNDGASCPRFINELLTNQNFKKCYPLSMLLQGSRSFFEAEKKLLSIVRVLDATCGADVDFCTKYLTGVAGNLTMDSNCGSDFDSGNPIVMQAYLGLKSYEMLYKATCLTDPETSMYCFANAVTNLTNPSNVYFYYLPLNLTLPSGATPTCGSCLKRTMEIYQTFTANRKLAISSKYVDASKQVNTICGPEFVSDILQAAVSMSVLSIPSWALTTVFIALAIAFNL
ncbi:C6 transcription factor [Colletotrichum truncatum]|uniref:C6 transcription factor n=1 Tax=Colletotrichum truncatum TaxID=5467 RepID=A0ACC3YJD8_COLTU|nr:C6 transcription factor [Colletotrichum truncatum]KAF6797224.1 C6 transcription factor [Colletotrichum truncatum]